MLVPHSSEKNVVLIGTGLAPLIASQILIEEGFTVKILNPDSVFFKENSEWAFDPVLPTSFDALAGNWNTDSIVASTHAILSPYFPGALGKTSNRVLPELKAEPVDRLAPWIRARRRLWLESRDSVSEQWRNLEEYFVSRAAQGKQVNLLEGFQAVAKFPGFSGEKQGNLIEQFDYFSGVMVEESSDVDASRYRQGIVDYLIEKIGSGSFFSNCSQMEFDKKFFRFTSNQTVNHWPLDSIAGFFCFWTPRLDQWIRSIILAGAKHEKASLPEIRLWERWSLISRDKIVPDTIASIDDLIVMAEAEGAPDQKSPLLQVYRNCGLEQSDWDRVVSQESFDGLLRLFHDTLFWDRFSIRSCQVLRLMDWENSKILGAAPLLGGPPKLKLIRSCDGALVSVVKSVERQITEILRESLRETLT